MRMSAWSAPLCVEGEVLDDVVVVAGRVEDQSRGLTLPDGIGGVDHHRAFALLDRDGEAPRTESKTAEVLAQGRATPCLAAVGRHLHRANAVTAVPGQTADDDFAGIHLGAFAMAGDERIEIGRA